MPASTRQADTFARLMALCSCYIPSPDVLFLARSYLYNSQLLNWCTSAYIVQVFIPESKWMFMPNLKKFPPGVP